MSAPTTIVVPLDGSSLALHALSHVQALMDAKTHVVLLTVVQEPTAFLPPEVEGGPDFGSTREAMTGRFQAQLDEVIAELNARGYPAGTFESRVVVGDPAASILEIASTVAADLVVMTTRGHGGLKRLMLGSVADRVVRHSPVPVVVVRPRDDENWAGVADIRRVIVPLDGSNLAEQALPLATDLATTKGIPLLLIRALPLNFVQPDLVGMYVGTPQLYDDIASAAREYLASVADRVRGEGLDVSTAAEWGFPLDVIDEVAEPDDIVVLTSHGRSGPQRWLLGSVADGLIRSLSCPVLLVPVRDQN